MPSFYVTILFLVLSFSLSAQADTSGMVIYRLHYNADAPEKDRFDTLYFNRTQYLYVSKWEGGQYTDGEGFNVTRSPRNKRYHYPATLTNRIALEQDYKKKAITYQSDSLEEIAWTFVDEFKEMNGYRVQKATATGMPFNEAKNLIAWFAIDVPVRVGPHGLYGLPGLIVEGYLYPDYHHSWKLEKVEYMPVNISVPNPSDYTSKNERGKGKGKKIKDRTRFEKALNDGGR